MAKVGVIVPIYNVEKYLPRCLESIYSQSFNDFELVLVDDGTQDTSSFLSDEYSLIHVNTISIHQKNGGVSVARNVALDFEINLKKTQYISFVDSDDYVNKDFLKLLYEANKKSDSDISACKFVTDDNVFNTKHDFKLLLGTPREAFINLKRECYPWAKMYNVNVFIPGGGREQFRFPVGKVFEDQWLIPKLIFNARKVAIVDAELYCYFDNPLGIIRTTRLSTFIDFWDAYEENIKLFSKMNDNELLKLTANDYMHIILTCYKYMQKKQIDNYSKKAKNFTKKRAYDIIEKYSQFIDNSRIDEAKAVFNLPYRITRKVRKIITKLCKHSKQK